MSSINDATRPGAWSSGALPAGVVVGSDTRIDGDFSFKRYHASDASAGLTIGDHCLMDGVQFAVGPKGSLRIGRYCHFTNAVLLCEHDVRIGDYVLIGWNATIADSDFHPIDPAQRVLDAIACSPLGKDRPRAQLTPRPIVIEDDVYVGPAATILKGVTIGRGSWIEAGAVVTRDVPAGSRVIGNPARIVSADSTPAPEVSR